ncbi:monofunctional biosynthetic peptidoglycan transglycosylase [Bacteroidia bacterium]|nr:monofunctional biosynthetic peptidoglycan transglycosylase [Bacteroidia bacterium]
MAGKKVKKRKWIRGAWKWGKRIAFTCFLGSVVWVLALRFVPVYLTPLMVIRVCGQLADGKKVKMQHKWVPLSRIAQPLALAVVASEDNRFLTHWGFDFEQIGKARKEAETGRRVRGASTITQQAVKNVFLWPGKSYIRKGLEAYFTLLAELLWSKERIMEIYLNSIEMGEGIYGAEAVAKAHFGKTASLLTRSEAALIAASLPNPRRFDSGRPSPYMYRRQAQILSLMNKVGIINMGCQ